MTSGIRATFVEADCYRISYHSVWSGTADTLASNVWTVNMVDNVNRIADISDTIPSFILHLAALFRCSVLRVLLLCHPEYLYHVRSTLVFPGRCLHDGTSVWIYLSAGFLSSYNVIYISLAAIPFSCYGFRFRGRKQVFGALLLPYQPTNIHYYDGDLQYDHLKLVPRIKVCGVVKCICCRRFNQGEQAYTRRNS